MAKMNIYVLSMQKKQSLCYSGVRFLSFIINQAAEVIQFMF